jgi:hypothetical protein
MEEKLDIFECGLHDCMTDTAIEVEFTRGYDLNKLLVCSKGKEVCTLYDYLSEYFGLLEDEILKFAEETFAE